MADIINQNMQTIYGLSKKITFTRHAQAKMSFYKLSKQRVLRVLHTPKRTEEGVAPKTVAAMQPGVVKIEGQKESWSQEIWVMFQDTPGERKIISAWRYPGVTKARSAISKQIMRSEYASYVVGEKLDKMK
jgi:hypothetical protein